MDDMADVDEEDDSKQTTKKTKAKMGHGMYSITMIQKVVVHKTHAKTYNKR